MKKESSTDIVTITPDSLSLAQEFMAKVIRPNYVCTRTDFFRWQYYRNAEVIGSDWSPTTLLAVSDERAVGISLGTRTQMCVNGAIIPGMWHTDWFADEKDQGAGLLLIEQQCKNNPFLGTAGQSLFAANVFGRIRPLIWFVLTRLFVVVDFETTLTFVMSTDPVDARLRFHHKKYLQMQNVAAPDLRVRVSTITRFDDEYDVFWSSFRSNYLIATNRTSAYMNWRYFEHPEFCYHCRLISTPVGSAYFVWREERVSGCPHPVGRICEVLGPGRALIMAFPSLYRLLHERNVVFADFFCSHAETLSSLRQAGMRDVITLPDFDLPRLFSPLQDDIRKTLNFAYSMDAQYEIEDRGSCHRMYFTRGDSNQDRPNS